MWSNAVVTISPRSQVNMNIGRKIVVRDNAFTTKTILLLSMLWITGKMKENRFFRWFYRFSLGKNGVESVFWGDFSRFFSGKMEENRFFRWIFTVFRAKKGKKLFSRWFFMLFRKIVAILLQSKVKKREKIQKNEKIPLPRRSTNVPNAAQINWRLNTSHR